MRHALADNGGRHARAAANCPAIGGRGDRRNPNQPFGQVAVSAADIVQPAPTPNRAREAALTRKGAGLRWFRLVVITLILIGVVATLVKSTWSNHSAPPPL
jgi:hypothetical protein